jgi:hypothetical protein
LLVEATFQSRFAVRAADELNEGLRLADSDRVWSAIHALLAATANLSKILWPTRPTSRARGDRLRRRLGITATSALRDRGMRDVFEHFDDKLEDWAASSERHNIVDQGILAPGATVGLDPGDYLRTLDPTSMVVSFRGTHLRLQPLVDAVLLLQEAVRRENARFVRGAG